MAAERMKFSPVPGVFIGRRTGIDIKAGKNIHRLSNGMENFADYFDDTEDIPVIEPPKEPSLQFRIGRRTGIDVRAGKNIRRLSNGMENFSDFFDDSSRTPVKIQEAPALDHGESTMDIGRLKAMAVRQGKIIRLLSNGMENFNDYFSASSLEKSAPKDKNLSTAATMSVTNSKAGSLLERDGTVEVKRACTPASTNLIRGYLSASLHATATEKTDILKCIDNCAMSYSMVPRIERSGNSVQGIEEPARISNPEPLFKRQQAGTKVIKKKKSLSIHLPKWGTLERTTSSCGTMGEDGGSTSKESRRLKDSQKNHLPLGGIFSNGQEQSTAECLQKAVGNKNLHSSDMSKHTEVSHRKNVRGGSTVPHLWSANAKKPCEDSHGSLSRVLVQKNVMHPELNASSQYTHRSSNYYLSSVQKAPLIMETKGAVNKSEQNGQNVHSETRLGAARRKPVLKIPFDAVLSSSIKESVDARVHDARARCNEHKTSDEMTVLSPRKEHQCFLSPACQMEDNVDKAHRSPPLMLSNDTVEAISSKPSLHIKDDGKPSPIFGEEQASRERALRSIPVWQLRRLHQQSKANTKEASVIRDPKPASLKHPEAPQDENEQDDQLKHPGMQSNAAPRKVLSEGYFKHISSNTTKGTGNAGDHAVTARESRRGEHAKKIVPPAHEEHQNVPSPAYQMHDAVGDVHRASPVSSYHDANDEVTSMSSSYHDANDEVTSMSSLCVRDEKQTSLIVREEPSSRQRRSGLALLQQSYGHEQCPEPHSKNTTSQMRDPKLKRSRRFLKHPSDAAAYQDEQDSQPKRTRTWSSAWPRKAAPERFPVSGCIIKNTAGVKCHEHTQQNERGSCSETFAPLECEEHQGCLSSDNRKKRSVASYAHRGHQNLQSAAGEAQDPVLKPRESPMPSSRNTDARATEPSPKKKIWSPKREKGGTAKKVQKEVVPANPSLDSGSPVKPRRGSRTRQPLPPRNGFYVPVYDYLPDGPVFVRYRQLNAGISYPDQSKSLLQKKREKSHRSSTTGATAKSPTMAPRKKGSVGRASACRRQSKMSDESSTANPPGAQDDYFPVGPDIFNYAEQSVLRDAIVRRAHDLEFLAPDNMIEDSSSATYKVATYILMSSCHMGLISIQAGQTKRASQIFHHNIILLAMDYLVNVVIAGNTWSVLSKGDACVVPKGLPYCICNMSTDNEAQLLFVVVG